MATVKVNQVEMMQNYETNGKEKRKYKIAEKRLGFHFIYGHIFHLIKFHKM